MYLYTLKFESFANSKRYKTGEKVKTARGGLRALLIQKDTKLQNTHMNQLARLRALLIQKDTKPKNSSKDN